MSVKYLTYPFRASYQLPGTDWNRRCIHFHTVSWEIQTLTKSPVFVWKRWILIKVCIRQRCTCWRAGRVIFYDSLVSCILTAAQIFPSEYAICAIMYHRNQSFSSSRGTCTACLMCGLISATLLRSLGRCWVLRNMLLLASRHSTVSSFILVCDQSVSPFSV